MTKKKVMEPCELNNEAKNPGPQYVVVNPNDKGSPAPKSLPPTNDEHPNLINFVIS